MDGWMLETFHADYARQGIPVNRINAKNINQSP
jgi:hypothetical protein